MENHFLSFNSHDIKFIVKDVQLRFFNYCHIQVSERFTPEEEVVLTVQNYKNHPQFNVKMGPIGGSDVALLYLDEAPLKKPGIIKKGRLYPACLPTKANKKRGIFAGRC